MTEEVPPNQTLYVNNLNDKVNKAETKRLLYHLFSAFGQIHEINISKAPKMRGQAFVVFDSVHAATSALVSLQAFVFLDKPMRIHYAKEKSDAIARLEGQFSLKQRQVRYMRRMQERIEGIKRQRALSAHKIVTVEACNMPRDADLGILTEVFENHRGFLRVFSKSGKVFIEFEERANAEAALLMKNFPITSEYFLELQIID